MPQTHKAPRPNPLGQGTQCCSRVGWYERTSNSRSADLAVMNVTTLEPRGSVVHAHRLRVGAAAAVGGIVAWWWSGYAVAATITTVAVLAGFAALIDARTARIPNRIVLAVLAVAVVSIPLVALLDDRSVSSVALAAVAGVAYSGAPLLFAVWVVRPSAIGGGDWKLVAALGATIGLVLPFAALVMTAVASLVQIGLSVCRRRQVQPFAPSLAIGYLAALLLLPALTSIFGGPYA